MPDNSFLDWPFFDQEHRRTALALREWTKDNRDSLEPANHKTSALDDHCRHIVALLGEAGWLRQSVSSVYGGVRDRLDVRSLCLCREILAYTSGLADFAFAMQGLGSGPISLFGSEAQKRRYLPRVAKGETITAFAISEPDAGSDVAAMTTRAVKDGGNYVIDGIKTWISNAELADVYVVFARTSEAPGARGLSAFVVDAGNPNLEVTERIPVIAPHPLGTLKFDGCRVSTEAMLGQPGEGFKVAMATLDIFRATVGAAALGFARRALDEALNRSQSRRLFDRTLADFQLTQATIADMAVAVDAAALLVYRAGWTKDTTGARVSREASMAKLFATEEAQKVIDRAVQMFGGQGVVCGNKVEELYREIRALRIYEGASEVQKLVIADTVFKGNKDAA